MTDRLRGDFHESWRDDPELKQFRYNIKYQHSSYWKDKGTTSVEETSTTRNLTYKGEKSIQSKEEAIEFFQVNLDEYEVEKFVVNSWDVTMQSGKRTNYQVKLFLRKIQKLIVTEPKIQKLEFKAKDEPQMWLVLGCVHRPFHNKVIWNALLHLIKDYKKVITGIILNGDYLDLRSLSSHEDYLPPGMSLGFEYSDGLQGLQDIYTSLGKENDRVEKIFHFGNHEQRSQRDKASILRYGSALMTTTEALRLEENNWKVVDDWKDGYTVLGRDLEVCHGVYFGETAAKKHLQMKPNVSSIFNHTHRFQSHSNGHHTAYNTGTLCDINSEGFKYSDRFKKGAWANGFCIAYVNNNGDHSVVPIKCINEGFFFGGKVY